MWDMKTLSDEDIIRIKNYVIDEIVDLGVRYNPTEFHEKVAIWQYVPLGSSSEPVLRNEIVEGVGVIGSALHIMSSRMGAYYAEHFSDVKSN